MLPNLQISKQDQAGMTALHYSAQQGHVDVCRALLTCGADPGISNHHGLTVIQVASDIVQQLLREEPAPSTTDIEAQLLDAAKNGDIGTVKVIYFIFSFLHIAAFLLQRLLSPQNVNCRDMKGTVFNSSSFCSRL